MNRPILGRVDCAPEHACVRCGCSVEHNILTNFVHDVGCWGWGTALFNAKVRLIAPDWFAHPA
jgi:hypothetical protein